MEIHTCRGRNSAMNLTILSATYANSDKSAVMLSTVELGMVLASPTGTPELWPTLDLANASPYVAPPGIAQARMTKMLQRFMDRKAWELGYDDIKTAITYRGDANTKFAAEAEAFFEWRSAVWTKAYEILALVNSGEASM